MNMKLFTTMLAAATLAFAAGCATTNDQASLGAVSESSSCSAKTACCGSDSCTPDKKNDKMPSLGAVEAKANSGCCASKKAAAEGTCPFSKG